MAQYLFITCTCSQKLSVTPADCGGTLRCSCGRMVDVPRLSDVREMSGLAAIDIGIVNRIKQQIVSGALPAEQNCVACNCYTSHIVLCEIECERRAIRGGGFWRKFFMTLVSAALNVIVADDSERTIHGRDISVIVPLHACERCAKKLRRSKRKRISALLRTDLYRELFAQYPGAMTRMIEVKEPLIQSGPLDNTNPYSYR